MTRMAGISFVADLQVTVTDMTIITGNEMIATESVMTESPRKIPTAEIGVLGETEVMEIKRFLSTTWMISAIT